jgi:hypothetical protein
MGDNITPPQQAFNWVADVYGSTDEIKARGQVIVGLLHQNIGHLGIFVSGKVATKEHAQIVSVLESIEALPPGLYGMQINPGKGGKGESQYEVTFVERTLEELVPRLNRFKRADEKPFEAVNAISDFNQRAYELFARPLIQSFSNEYSAKLQREFHPLRFQRWSISDWNPWTWWLQQSAELVKAQRKAAGADHPLRKSEKLMSELISASLDYYRALRDAASEAAFFQTYGNLFSLYLADKPEARAEQVTDPRELPVVKQAMAAIAHGGYPEAVARVAYLLARKGEPLPLSRLQLKQELVDEYHDLLPAIPWDEARRIRGEQEIIVRYEPEKAMETLPALLSEVADRDRLLALLDRLLADKRVQAVKPSAEQVAALGRIRAVLGAGGAREQQRELVKRGQRSVH